MLKGRTFIYHFTFWAALYLLWIGIFRSYSFSLTKTMTIEFCYLIFITIDYYVINDFIIPHFLFRKRYGLLIFATILTIGISAWLRALVAEQMTTHFFHSIILPEFNSLYLNSVTNISIWVLAVIIGKMIIDSNQTQQQVALLEKERIKNELDYLKAQINPHALFNSLNTIYGHIDKNNQMARNTLLQFSELLRYQLYDCGAEKVNLKKEIEYIQNYIVFQQLRKDEQLKVSVDIEITETDLKIAPLLLVVLIENAFKFVSTFSDKENKISIRVYTKDNFLYSSFINTKELQEKPTAKDSGGIGITNLKRRLELLYNNKYQFTTNDSGNLYETSLIINLA
jgi:two-component system LytT family sensor kinase